jgi:hypothetical protein
MISFPDTARKAPEEREINEQKMMDEMLNELLSDTND